jgi:glycosyltransferase involved in cell wall biosynthesis
MKTAYVVISPVRDEEETIEATLGSMLAQTVPPRRWIIVNDGSRDRTREIVERHLRHCEWIELLDREDRGFRSLGAGVVEAFNAGLERVRGADWDFVVKLDGDLSFAPDYFESLLRRFDADPRLGMASGKTFLLRHGRKVIEWCHDDHVRGPAKMYSRECFEAIDGLRPVRGWDMIDETVAQMRGFETRSYLDLELVHHRPIDARQPSVLRSRFEMGRLYHHLGYHWLYHLVRCLRSSLQDYPRGVGGILLLAGYASAALARAEKYDPEYVAFVRERQRARFRLGHLRDYLRAMTRRTAA